jgi:NAD(P)-dependent dehydrogenase (short-subunit alcohol dehydrogenase family)
VTTPVVMTAIDRNRLEDKTALVTSGSRNLGAAVVTALARAGVTVAVNYHSSKDAAAELMQGLRRDTGRNHVALYGDTSTGAGARALAEDALVALGGRVDVLVNNSGPFAMEPFVDLDESAWDRVLDANLKASYLTTQVLAPAMREAGWGRIVNVSAGSAFLRNHSVYGLAKDAVIFLTEELALELGPEVRVNCIAPGQIAESAKDISAIDPTFVERAIEHTPARRLVTRPEVADMVVLLCSPTFDSVTGATIPMDGGWRFNRF